MLTYQKEARTIIQEEDRNLQLVALIQRKYLRGKGRKTIQMTFRILDFFFSIYSYIFFLFYLLKIKTFSLQSGPGTTRRFSAKKFLSSDLRADFLQGFGAVKLQEGEKR